MRSDENTVDRRKAERLASQLHGRLQNLFRSKLNTEINASELKAEVMAIHKDFFDKSGLKLIYLDKTAAEFKIPASVKRMMLMDDIVALKTEENAKRIIQALDKDEDLKSLLNKIIINKDQKLEISYGAKLKTKLADIDALDPVVKHFKSKLIQSQEYKKYIEEKDAFQKHLDKHYNGDLKLYNNQNRNKPELEALNKALKNYELKDLVTQIELAKTQIVMLEIADKPEKVEEFVKYLDSDAHKKHMEAFEKVNGMSFVKYEVGMLKALTASRDLEKSVSDAVDDFIAINNDEELDARIKRKAVDQTAWRCEDPLFAMVFSCMMISVGMAIMAPAIASAVVPMIVFGAVLASVSAIALTASTACYISESKITEHDTFQAKAQMLDENAELSSALRDTYKNAITLGEAMEKVTSKEKAPQQAARGA